jgi:hypothetical protein
MREAHESCYRWNEFGKLRSFRAKSGSKSDDVLAAEGADALHTVKYRNT